MPLIEWTDHYSVNIAEVDEQHKRLISLVNEMFEAARTGKGSELTSRMIREMVAYAKYHFSLEEKYMQSVAYPAYDAHRELHGSFIRRVAKFEEDHNRGAILSISLGIMTFLAEWVTGHIMEEDKKFAQYLRPGATLR